MRSKKAIGLVLLVCFALSLSVRAQNERERVVAQTNADGSNSITLKLKATLGSHREQLDSIAFSPDGRFLATGGYKVKTKLWDVAAGRLIAELDGSIGLAGNWDASGWKEFSPDGRTLVTARGTEASLWDVPTGKLKFTLSGHEREITATAFSPDGERLATAGSDGTVRLWNVSTGQLFTSFVVWRVKKISKLRIVSRALNVPITAKLSFNPDGSRILTTIDWETSPAKLWDAQTGQLVATLEHTKPVFNQTKQLAITGASFSPDGKYIVTNTYDGEMGLWDGQTGQAKKVFTDILSSQLTAFSPDARLLVVVGYRGQTGLWNVSREAMQSQFGVEINFLNQMVFSPDSQTLALASGYKKYHATLVEASTGRIKATMPLVSKMGFDYVSDYQKDADLLAFHPNSRWLMGCNHNSVKFWDAETGHLITEITQGRSPAVISPDGRRLVTAGKDKKSVLVWEIVGV